MATEILNCSAVASDNANWVLTAGASKVAAVNTPDDDDTSYISCASSTAQTIRFDTANPVNIGAGDTINSVRLVMRHKKSLAAGVTTFSAGMRSGTSTVLSPSVQASTNTTWTTTNGSSRVVDPNGNIAWTLAGLNGLQLELRVTNGAGGNTCHVTSAYFEVDYTPAAGGVSATPSTLALTTATFAPTVAATANQVATPPASALATTTFAPAVVASDHKTATPDVASLTLTPFAPTVTATDHQAVTPDPASLTLAGFAPDVTTTANQTVTPSPAALELAGFAPSVVASDHQVVAPGAASLTLTAFEPDVAATTGGAVSVTPEPAELVLTTFAPSVVATVDTPPSPPPGPIVIGGGWSGSSYASPQWIPPSKPQRATPGPASLRLTTYAPSVRVSRFVVKPTRVRPRAVVQARVSDEAELEELMLLEAI